MESKLRQRWPATVFGLVRRSLVLAGAGLLGAAAGVSAQQPEPREGVLIVAVEPHGPAAGAGLARGDIILSMAGVPVNSVPELVAVLEQHAGAKVEVRFRHGDDLRTVSVALGGEDDAWLGITPESRDLLFWLRERLRSLRSGNLDLDLSLVAGARLTMVVEAGPAAAAGLQAGDVITHLDGVPVSKLDALPERIGAAVPGTRIDLHVLRDGAELKTTVTLGRHPQGDGAYLGVRYEPWLSIAPWQRRNRDRENRDRESPPSLWNIGDLLRI